MHIGVNDEQDALTATARQVLEALVVVGPMSRADLSRRLTLSAATLTKVVRFLLESGYCVESPVDAPSTGGRPPQPVDVNADFAHFVGIKLTDTTAYFVVTDARARVLVDRDEPLAAMEPASVARQLGDRVNALRGDDPRIAAVGIALSGTATPDSPIVHISPFLHWKEVPLADLVNDIIGIPVVLENDVRAVTAAEQWFGAAAALDSFAVITLGAGIGCGLVVNGRRIDGHLGASGLVGHLRIPGGALICYAGHPGCVNAYATTGAIGRRMSVVLGRGVDFDETLALAAGGDAAAREILADAGRAVGTILATVVNLLGPERVFVLGDGVALFDHTRAIALDTMRGLLHWTATEVEVESQPFGFTEWARGAAAVAVQAYIELLQAGPSPAQQPRPIPDPTTRGAA